MSGQCYGCGLGFGVFKKEHGCKNCGFAFCSKCLTKKASIPKLKNEKHSVCNKCFDVLAGRIASLQERQSSGPAPKHSIPQTGHRQSNVTGMSKSDMEIAKRLEKLKEKTPAEAAAAKVTVQEIDQRLAHLKGMDPARYSSGAQKSVYQGPDRRTEQEKINDLLDEIADEVEIDSHRPDPALEVEQRLAQIRGGQNSQTDLQENDLNKSSPQDAKGFSQNIPDGKGAENSEKLSNSAGDDSISVEEMNRILSDAAKELEIDAQRALEGLEKDKEIMKKLKEVKQRRKESKSDINKDEDSEAESDSENESEQEDVIAQKLMQRYLKEAKLDEAAAKDKIDMDKVGSRNARKAKPKKKVEQELEDDDELPYCCICTDDAVLRCHDCDLDLYCTKCWKESHTELGMEDHRTSKYTPPKGKT
ncbi:hypothetical protein CHS0354_032939 [Potamilus streckersoni]|uniref:FYVE-type domain-containing protein n=1 Tax=Potamilus streckersoni TaxID=2493646 RepID=A0AAE0VL66_9BIVA|nr:hypothetical protein CHS0354_032939 [Potamilus streckersoni]